MSDQIRFASATTTETHAAEVIRDLVDQIKQQIGETRVDFALAFLSPHHGDNVEIISRGLRDNLSPGVLVGCTGEGIIGSDEEIERQPAVSLVTSHMPNVTLTPTSLRAERLHRTLAGADKLLGDLQHQPFGNL